MVNSLLIDAALPVNVIPPGVIASTAPAHGIDHRLIKPRHPQTNGLVARFNGRISEVLATTSFDSAQCLAVTLSR